MEKIKLKGELIMGKKGIDLTGRIFGRLTVIKKQYSEKFGINMWICECSCANKTQKLIRTSHLTSGAIVSCGCLKNEKAKNRFTTHGMSNTNNRNRFYSIWLGLKSR